MRAWRKINPELGPHSVAIRFERELIRGFPALRADAVLYEPADKPKLRVPGRVVDIAFLGFETEHGPIVSRFTMEDGVLTPKRRLILPQTPRVKEVIVPPRSEDGQPWLTVEVPADRVELVTEALQQLAGGSPPPFDITPQ